MQTEYLKLRESRQGYYTNMTATVTFQAELRKRADEEIAKRESEFKEMLDQMERDHNQKEQVCMNDAAIWERQT